jgi:pimeloyl-ACP methyl ester carboxylesterase
MRAFQRSLIYFPQPRTETPGTGLLQLSFDDAVVNVTTLQRPSAEAVIYFGGNGEDTSLSLPALAEAFPQDSIYLMHYRGYGGSTGTPSEKILVADALALFDKVSGDQKNITVVGRSLGSGVAIQLASQRPASRLILVTPYDSIENIAARQFPYVPVSWLLEDKFESWKYAEKIKAPTTIIAAEHDEVVPASSTAMLLAHFREGIARFAIIRKAGHNTVSDPLEYILLLRGA